MAKQKTNNQIQTPEFRVSFPSVFQAREAMDANSKPKFTVTMLFPKSTDLKVLKDAVTQAVKDKWGTDSAKWPKGLRLPFRDGAEKDYDGYENVTFCSATSVMRPGLVDRAAIPITEISEFYGGCYAWATINAFAYDVKGNKGVAFGLRNIQKLRDGDAFSGKNKPENDFNAIPMPEGQAGEETAGAVAGGAVDDDPLGLNG